MTHVFETAGEFVVRLTVTESGRSSKSEALIKVEPGAAAWVTVTSDTSVVTAGDTVQLDARAFDELGNEVNDAVIAWETDGDAGSVTEEGLFTAGAVSGLFVGAVRASFDRLGSVGTGAYAITVEPGPMSTIEIEPRDLSLLVGQRISLTAIVTDPIGTVIDDARVTFNAVRPGDSATAGGEIRIGTQASGGMAELVRVTAERGPETITQTFVGTVKPSVLDEIIVSPSVLELAINEQVSLSAFGRDRFGNTVVLDDVEYELADDVVGDITSDGVFKASSRATSLRDSSIMIKGWSEGVWRRATVLLRVTPGPAATIEILPTNDSVAMGASSPMIAIVRDEYGNELVDPPLNWATGAGGFITEDGTFIAGLVAGEFAHTIIATIPVGSAGNAAQIGATTTVTVRPRSADMIALDLTVDQDSDIALIDLRTASIHLLIEELPGDGRANESGATWYPDGSRLVFSSDATGLPQIYDFDIESGQVRQLTDDPNGAIMPAISPDGNRLAWVSTRADRLWRIYWAEIPSDGGDGIHVAIGPEDAIKVSGHDDVQSLLPFWSPDGTMIAYTVSRSISDNDIRLASADGTGEVRLISGPGYAGLGWSPDGSKLRATVTAGQFVGLLVDVDIESDQIIQSVPIPIPAFSATWSPDGSEVGVIDRFTGEFWLTDSDGTGLRMILSGSAGVNRMAWRPIPITGPLVATDS